MYQESRSCIYTRESFHPRLKISRRQNLILTAFTKVHGKCKNLCVNTVSINNNLLVKNIFLLSGLLVADELSKQLSSNITKKHDSLALFSFARSSRLSPPISFPGRGGCDTGHARSTIKYVISIEIFRVLSLCWFSFSVFSPKLGERCTTQNW